MSSNAPVPVSFDSLAVGRSSTSTFITTFQTRDPTSTDVNYQVQQRWYNTAKESEWILTSFSVVSNVKTAVWQPIASFMAAAETLTGNTGGAVGVDGSNNINVVGTTLYTVAGNPATHTLTVTPGVNAYPITPYVVGPVGQAGYQTIQAGINAAHAAGGGQVWIQEGTYTENLTLYTGIQLSSPSEQSVTIIGTHTPPAAGTLNIDRMTFQSATDIFFSAAAGTTSIILEDCTVNATNGYSFNLANFTASASLACFNIGPGGTNDGFINNTGGMSVAIYAAGVGNGIGNSMIISGSTLFGPGITIGCPVHLVTGASVVSTNNQYFHTFTFSNNSTASFYNDSFTTGATPAITQSSTGIISLSAVTINSSNSPAISGAGAGTVTLTDVNFTNNTTISASLTLSQGLIRGGNFPTQLVVGASPDAYYQTIQSAINAASSGQTVFVKTGTYTENLTLKAGVNITAFSGDALAPNVTIVGKATFTGSGTVALSNMRLQTNADFFLAVTGSAASIVYLNECYLACSNHTGISYTSSSGTSAVLLQLCMGIISDASSSLFSSSGAGSIALYYSNIAGSSTVASTVSAGIIGLHYNIIGFPLTTSGTAALSSVFNAFECGSLNTTSLTVGGSGGAVARGDSYSSGTASAVSVGSTLTMAQAGVDSTNAHVITGAGTLNAGIITFTNTGNNINTSTVNKLTTYGGTIV